MSEIETLVSLSLISRLETKIETLEKQVRELQGTVNNLTNMNKATKECLTQIVLSYPHYLIKFTANAIEYENLKNKIKDLKEGTPDPSQILELIEAVSPTVPHDEEPDYDYEQLRRHESGSGLNK